MTDVQIDAAVFRKRIHQLQRKIVSNDDTFAGAHSIFILIGKSNDANPYIKSSVVHTWLLGYEFPTTALLITKDRTIFITSSGKAKYLETIKSKDVEVWTRNKDAEHNTKLFQDLKEIIESTGNFGILPKDKYEGPFVTEWQQVWESKVPDVDVTAGLSAVMEVKDEDELRTIRTASKASMGLMTRFFAEEMSTIIDEDRTVTHSELSQAVENKIEESPAYFRKELKLGPEFEPSQLDWCYSPIVQSGHYDLKPSAVSDDNKLDGGVIICSLGLRYKSYCSNIGRTYLIDPTKEQEQHYSLVVALQKKVLDSIREGAHARDVYATALEFLRAKAPDLVKHLVKNVGWGIGIEFRDTSLILNAKNSHILKDGMTLNVVVGLQDLPGPRGTYSLLLVDTIRVTPEAPVVFTDSPKTRGDISYYFKDDAAAETPAPAPAAKSAILKSKLRGETRPVEEDTEGKRKLHQKELQSKLQRAGLSLYADASKELAGRTQVVQRKFESYKREEQLPVVSDLRLHVDAKTQTILVPINGRPVPFHINTYKNGSKNEEGDYVYLRLNFNTGAAPGGGEAATTTAEVDGGPSGPAIRSITLRSRDGERMADALRQITELKKAAVKREAEKKELADMVQQAKLIEVRNRRPLRLDSVFVRPVPEGKRVAGSLEVHQNGLRYQSPVRSDHSIDVLFSNIKHLFFQPCDHELIVLIHAHLKNPIMVGKRKTKDVQFYREASDMAFDETGNRKRRYRYGDEDELEQEQEERRRRAALNKEFKSFCDKIADASAGLVDVDIPVRELGFSGVPFRSNVLCQPTTECLVQLIDPPFLVVTIAEIEIAHLERIQFGLKQFDLVFVYKDFERPVTHINSIPMLQLDAVKDWLNEMDIAYYEGPVNLNWPTIMKTVTTSPHRFFQEGGWSFLELESDDEEESEEESEFQASEESEEVSEGSDYSEASASGSEVASDSEEEEADDWDELDDKARKEDARRERRV